MFSLKELIEKSEDYVNDKIFEINIKNNEPNGEPNEINMPSENYNNGDKNDSELEYVWLKIQFNKGLKNEKNNVMIQFIDISDKMVSNQAKA